jgi:hypothetical protein
MPRLLSSWSQDWFSLSGDPREHGIPPDMLVSYGFGSYTSKSLRNGGSLTAPASA